MKSKNAILTFVIIGLSTIGCKSRSSAKNDSSAVKGYVIESDLPAKVMYHFGDKEILLRNDGKSTFSDVDWKKITDGHAPFRQGLYVGQHPAYAERYTHKLMIGPDKKQPWLMKVTIKDECLKPQKVAPYFTDLYKDQQFMDWYVGLRQRPENDPVYIEAKEPNYLNRSFTNFVAHCVKNLNSGNVYTPVTDQDEIENIWKSFDADKFESPCANTFELYLKNPVASDPTATIGIVRDTKWPNRGFWYIRDRECIESMESNPESVSKVFVDTKELWDKSPLSSSLPVVLPDDKVLKKFPLLSIFFESLKQLDFSSAYMSFKGRQKENSDYFDQKLSLKKPSEFNFVIPRVLFEVSLNAVERCSTANKLDQELLRKILTEGNESIMANPDLEIISNPTLIKFFKDIDGVCGSSGTLKLKSGKIQDESGDYRVFEFDSDSMKLKTNSLSSFSQKYFVEYKCLYPTASKSILNCKYDKDDVKVGFAFMPNGIAIYSSVNVKRGDIDYWVMSYSND